MNRLRDCMTKWFEDPRFVMHAMKDEDLRLAGQQLRKKPSQTAAMAAPDHSESALFKK